MTRTLIIAASLDNLPTIRRFVRETTADLQVPPAGIDDLELAVDELATNIVRHGYRGEPGEIEIETRRNADAVEICLRDRALPFDPTQVPEVDINAPLERRRVGGLGVHLVRQLVDTCTYRRTSQGDNELTLTKKTDVPSRPLQETPHANND